MPWPPGSRYAPDVRARREECTAWGHGSGINLRLIPDEEQALVVTPINEGELHARWLQVSKPLTYQSDRNQWATDPAEAILTDPPPGFTLPEWDAYRYIYTGRGCDRD